MKRTFYTEMAYIIGIVTLAFGTALMERADFGMSMVVAPAYLIYLKISDYLNWFSFGMAEYCFQAFLIIVLVTILRGFKRKYLFSFITAFIYGNVLDVMMRAVALVSANGIIPRVAFYVIGLVVCAVGVSLLFHTYISPEAIFEKYVPLGFNNFKIEGRTGNLFNLIESYCLWLMKPEKRDEGRFMLITTLQATKVINVAQPRPGVWP